MRPPSGPCSVISRVKSPGASPNRRISRVQPPLAHLRTISTVRLSIRRDDWVPRQVASLKSRALPSKYRIVLNVDALPSAATVSCVNTSPPACGSIRRVILLRFPECVERAGFSFHTPKDSPAQDVAPSNMSSAIRMWLQCRQKERRTSFQR
jgi:hypothetical protein